jgi:deoxyribodipyrimidine photo-lyase
MTFESSWDKIMERLHSIEPDAYGSSRNYIDGKVSYLSPYIARGVISTKMVYEYVLQLNLPSYKTEKFIQELAWRDYWQQIWIAKKEQINSDLKHPQPDTQNFEIPTTIVNACTGIEAIDKAILHFYETGYMHNHLRMYVASLSCNIAKSHWLQPAKWMYYHLLDADWASNALSWQWVAGANSNKKYYANQANINKYCHTNQTNTYLDISYYEFDELPIPKALEATHLPIFKTALPTRTEIKFNPEIPTLIYNFYNMDPLWKKDLLANRVLLLEPEHFDQYPISSKTLVFLFELGKNISDLQVFVGSFSEFVSEYANQKIFYKEHPLNNHYQGIKEPRDWMFNVEGYFPSFFAFWKKCQNEMLTNKTI